LPTVNFGKLPQTIDGLDTRCKKCKYQAERIVISLKKVAPPKPDNCECCGAKTDDFHFDHCHTTNQFRGWLCRSCNLGLGFLGDNIAGLERAIKYLSKSRRDEIQNKPSQETI
jgi:hypothetical protein